MNYNEKRIALFGVCEFTRYGVKNVAFRIYIENKFVVMIFHQLYPANCRLSRNVIDMLSTYQIP